MTGFDYKSSLDIQHLNVYYIVILIKTHFNILENSE